MITVAMNTALTAIARRSARVSLARQRGEQDGGIDRADHGEEGGERGEGGFEHGGGGAG